MNSWLTPLCYGASSVRLFLSLQIVAFLEKLAELRSLQPLHPSTTRKMAHLYKLEDSKNSEIRCSWYQLCVKAGEELTLFSCNIYKDSLGLTNGLALTNSQPQPGLTLSKLYFLTASGDETVLPKVEGFLNEQGRMKYLRCATHLPFS